MPTPTLPGPFNKSPMVTVGESRVVRVMVPVSGTYTIGKCAGGLLTLTDVCRNFGGFVTLVGIAVKDLQGIKAPLTFVFFSEAPTGIADGAVPNLDSQTAKIEAAVPVLATDYTTIGGGAMAFANISQSVLGQLIGNTETTRKLYLAILAGATANYGVGVDQALNVSLKFLLD